MSKYKIVATIDGYTNEGRVKLRGTGDYLHKVPKGKNVKEDIYKNVIVATDKDATGNVVLKFLEIDVAFSINKSLNNPFFQSALGISFANRKPLKFDIIEEEDKTEDGKEVEKKKRKYKYTITGISQPNEEE
ncbi:hypothetical protein AGMMS49938_06520 [Fibrobacterales bacterium]|nr:hypothetical protein AGMMS49938_06520 [Fibrobacterales bacterium]